jgi:transcriptional regulator NrdR family protein
MDDQIPPHHCAECGSPSHVTHIVPTGPRHLRRRRRECVNCGTRWSTLEARAPVATKRASPRRRTVTATTTGR